MAEEASKRSLIDHFSALEDPRQAWKVIYPLPEIMLLVLCATLAGAAEAAHSIAVERQGFYVNQFHAPEGVQAHEETTGPEIWEQSGGRVDAWVASVGTGA